MSADARVAGVLPQRFGGRVIVDERYAEDFDEAMFEPAYWYERGAVTGIAGGRGRVLFVARPGPDWVLRHYYRGGMMSAVLGDRYLWKGHAATRSMREWRLLAELYDEGLSVPRPVAARYRRSGPFYRADLITLRIDATVSLAELAMRGMAPEQTWRAVGACLRRFHDAGVFHADLNAHNIVLDGEGTVYLVDFDRGRRRGDGAWKRANLQRLNRSLHKIGLSLSQPDFEQQQWRALREAYASAR